MKLSVIISHFNRKKILYHTLSAYGYYGADDCEFVIVDDCSNEENDISSIVDDFPNMNIKFIQIDKKDKTWILPTVPFNIAINNATSDKLLIVGPEIFPMGNILSNTADYLKENIYLVYSCYSVNEVLTEKIVSQEMISAYPIMSDVLSFKMDDHPINKEGDNGWYQHSEYRPVGLCFALAIYKETMKKIGCFNDIYSFGIGWADCELFLCAKRKNITIEMIDDPFVLHLYHYKNKDHIYNQKEAIRNKEIFYQYDREGIQRETDFYESIYKKYLCVE